jgi:hypothetical protein
MEVSGQLHALAALPPGKEPPVTIGYEAGVDMVSKKKFLSPRWESNPDHSIV